MKAYDLGYQGVVIIVSGPLFFEKLIFNNKLYPMYRVCMLSGRYYAVKFHDIDEEAENIMVLANEGTPVVVCGDLDEAADLYGIEVEDIEVVD